MSDDPKICHRCGADDLEIDESGQLVLDPMNYAIICDTCGWFAEHHSYDFLYDWIRKPVDEKRKDFDEHE